MESSPTEFFIPCSHFQTGYVSKLRGIWLTDRDQEILSMLSLRVRLASLGQLSQTWWSACAPSTDACAQRLRRLEVGGLVLRQTIRAIRLSALIQPLATWLPGQWTPNLGAVAWQLRQRWQVARYAQAIYLATPRCARYFGGRRGGRIAHVFQASHDLGVTQMFLALRRVTPHFISRWIDEDRLAPFRRHQKLPDAVLAERSDARPSLVLEFGGLYSKVRLQAFHDDCQERGLPYQIW